MLMNNNCSPKGKFSRFISHPVTLLASRLLLGGTFIFAGIAKVSNITTLIWEIKQYQIIGGGLATAYGYLLPFAEIILGALILAGLLQRISAALTGLLTLSFLIAKITAVARGLDIHICGCFGPAVPLLSIYSWIIDFVLLVLAVHLSLLESKFLWLGSFLKKKAH